MYKFIKRLFDIFFSLVALILLLPILFPIAIILLFTGEHEVFYFQKRIGYKNEEFDIWKFATMLKASEKLGTGTITLPGDKRILPFGKFLRNTKLNELPQLINILKGDMSIVGPRPVVRRGWNRFPEDIRYKIYNSKPGLTGIGSIVFRDEGGLVLKTGKDLDYVYSNIVFPHKGRLEIWYQENFSFWTDIKIIFFTAWVILFPNSQLYKKVFRGLPEMQL